MRSLWTSLTSRAQLESDQDAWISSQDALQVGESFEERLDALSQSAPAASPPSMLL